MEPSGNAEADPGDGNVGNSFLFTGDMAGIGNEVEKFSLVPVNVDGIGADENVPASSTSTSTSLSIPSFEVMEAVGGTTINMAETRAAMIVPSEIRRSSNDPVNYPSVTPRLDRPGRMTNQLKFLQTTLCQSLWRRKEAWEFRYPVDPIALMIPDYHDIIKNPMDLSTIKQRLQNQYYWTAQECLDDFNLMFSNCQTFNNPGDPIVRNCLMLKKCLLEKLKQMPTMEAELWSGSKSLCVKKSVSRNRKISESINTSAVSAGWSSNTAIQIPFSGKKCIKRKADTTTPAHVNQDFKHDVEVLSGQPLGQVAPSRELVPKVSEAGRRTRPRLSGELRQCKEILKELMSKKHRAIAFFFYEPVDPEVHGAPGYFDVIKNPMDLGTVQKRLDQGFYQTCSEFAVDVRLIFENCLTYNREDQLLRQAAQKMQALFEEHFAVLVDESGESEAYEHEETLKPERIFKVPRSPESEDDSDVQKKILVLKAEIALKKQEILALEIVSAQKKLEKLNRQANGKPPKRKKPNRGKQRGSTITSETAVIPMDTNEIRKLSVEMMKLPPEAHSEVFQIMQRMEPGQGANNNDEFTVDLPNLQPRTLRTLQAYTASYFQMKAQAYASDHSVDTDSARGDKVGPSKNNEEDSDCAMSSSSSSSDDSSSSSDSEEDGGDETERRQDIRNLRETSTPRNKQIRPPQPQKSNKQSSLLRGIQTQILEVAQPQKQSSHVNHVQKQPVHLPKTLDQSFPHHMELNVNQKQPVPFLETVTDTQEQSLLSRPDNIQNQPRSPFLVDVHMQALPPHFDIQKQPIPLGGVQKQPVLLDGAQNQPHPVVPDNNQNQPFHQLEIQDRSIPLNDPQKQSVEKDESQQLSNFANVSQRPNLPPLDQLSKRTSHVPTKSEQQEQLLPTIHQDMVSMLMRPDHHRAFQPGTEKQQVHVVPHSEPRCHRGTAPYALAKPLMSFPSIRLPLDAIKAKQEHQKQQEDKRRHEQELAEKRRLQAEKDNKELQERQHRLADERRKHQQRIALSRSHVVPHSLLKPLRPPIPLRDEPVENSSSMAQGVPGSENTAATVDAERQKMREEEQRRRKQVGSQIDLNFQAELLSKFEAGEWGELE